MKEKIMLVDDEEYILTLYSDELIDDGYKVVALSSVSGIMDKIEEEDPDLVILDINLGGHNGLDLLQDIKNRYGDMPVGICSAYDTFRDDMKSIAADFYVVRSLDLNELKNNIAACLDLYRQKVEKPRYNV